MSDYIIYHNPKCSKSRQTLELLQKKGIEPKVVEYLKDPLNQKQITELIQKLDVEAKLLVRTKEAIFKENKPPIGSDKEIAQAIAKFPKIMERPVVVHGTKAIIGRPPENVLDLI